MKNQKQSHFSTAAIQQGRPLFRGTLKPSREEFDQPARSKTEASRIEAAKSPPSKVTIQQRIAKHTAQFEESRFAAMTIMITFQSCLGSIAAYYALINDAEVSLYLSAMVTMAANAVFLAQSPAKICLAVFYGSVVTNFIIIGLNLMWA